MTAKGTGQSANEASQTQGSKLMVANVQNATELRLSAPKLFDPGATLLLKFLKLIWVWHSKPLISFLVINLCLKGFSLEA